VNGMLPPGAKQQGLELLAFEKIEADAALGEGILKNKQAGTDDKAVKGEFKDR